MKKFFVKDLSSAKKSLLKKADQATKLSHSPYSEFAVGVAIQLDNGEIVLGANQENASYPLSICAERVALHNAAINFPKQKIKILAIKFHSKKVKNAGVLSPCGGCRQVILEYERKQKQPIEIIMTSSKDEILIAKSITELLPNAFSSESLK